MPSWSSKLKKMSGQFVRAGWIAVALFSVVVSSSAAEPPVAELRDLAVADQASSDRNFDYAEKLYSEFITKYPASTLLTEALLGKAKALYWQQKFDDALSLLRDNLPRAGAAADQFEYWIGENLFSKGDLDKAEAAFAGLISKYPASTNVLAAALAQADTQFQKRNYDRTVSLLNDPAGAFVKARAKDPQAEAGIRGVLLLGDALFELKRYKEIEPLLATLPAQLSPRPAWRRAALLARTLIATGRAAQAQANMTNVLARAAATGDPEVIAETHALNGEVLEQLKRPAEALAAYAPNLKADVAENWRKQAIAKTVELTQASEGPASTIAKLELLSSKGLDASARDLVQLTMGELRLGLFRGLPPAERGESGKSSTSASNYLHGALGNFTNVINGFTNSPYLARAWLDRGWCNWYLQQWPAAAGAFGESVNRFPDGLEKAQALFKLGDSLYQQKQYEGALTNYAKLVRTLGEIPGVKKELLDQAYYQMIQAAIQTTNQPEAEFAVKALLAQFPGKFYAERGLLLVGQFLNDIDQPAKSRAVMENFSNRFPNSTLAPEIELAIARTYELEDKWRPAASIYDSWIHHYTNHASLPSAMFQHAFDLYQADDLTNAVAGLTNFVARFPDNDLAAKAYLQLGNYYDSIKEYSLAELNYQQLFSGAHYTNWPVSRLTYEARIFAGRAALERQGYADARADLTSLLNKVESCPSNDVDFVSANCCPRDIYAEALFAYGDVYAADSTMDVKRFDTALTAFQHVVDDFPESTLVPAAWARVGECGMQLGLIAKATNAFLACMNHPLASVSERSQAEVELGQAIEKDAEKQPPAARPALLDAARDHYLNVFYQKNIDRKKGEVADNLWLKQSCEAAAKLARNRHNFAAAAGLYEHLREMLPVLSEYYDAQIRELKELSRAGR